MKKKLRLTLGGIMLASGLFAQISTFPHFTDFETEALCGTACTGSCNPAGGWKNGDQYGFAQAGTDWLVEDGSTPSTATGPDIDHTVGSVSGKYIYIETSGCNNVTAHLVSAIYDFSAVSQPKIRFWYHMLGATMGTMHLDVDTSGLGNWVLDVVPTWIDNLNIWQLKDASLGAFGGKSNVRIRIRGITGTSFTSDMAVDDIEVYQPVANDIDVFKVLAGGGCGNSVTTPVVISMINTGSNTIPAGTLVPVAFEINTVVVLDTVLTSTTILPNDTLMFTFTNGFADLSGPLAVSITAWADWSVDGLSGNDTATSSATGIPVITNFPYFENLESGPNGWIINNLTNGTWAFGTPAKATIIGAASGVNAFTTGGLTGFYVDNEVSYVQGPCFDFTNICDPVISMRVWWNAEFSWDGMNVTISTDGGTTWTLVGDMGDPLNWYNDNSIVGNPGGFQSGWSGRASTSNGSGGWVTARHRLIGAGGMSNVKIRINFATDGSVTDDGTAFDDIHIFNGTDLGMDQAICGPATANLDAYHGNASATYLWSTGETTQSIIVDSTDTYSVTIIASGTCTVTDSVYIAVIDSTSAVVLGPDSSTCVTGVMLNAGYWPASTYAWSSGETTQMINANSSGTYIASVTTPCGILKDTVVITVNPLPLVAISGTTSICAGGNTTLTAGGAATYSWMNGPSSAVYTVFPVVDSTFIVTGTDSNGCSNNDTAMIIVNSLPVVNLGNDSTQCGGSVILDAGVYASYSWSNGDLTQTSAITSTGSYYVMVTDINGCSDNDTAMITVNSLPVVNLGNDSIQCGGTVILDAGVYASYSWSNGDLTQTSVITSTGSYSVMVADINGCEDSDTLMITINTPPTAGLVLSFTNVCEDAGIQALTGGTPAGGVYSGVGVTGSDFSPATAGAGTFVIDYIYADINGCSDTASQSVTVTVCLGYNETFSDAGMSIYPNPSNGLFTLELNDLKAGVLSLVVIDGAGRKVMDKQINANTTSIRTELDLGSLDNGFYFLLLKSGDASKTVKLVLNK